ncbi:MAG: hypothetical protein EPO64_03340 [Nitrospirae bacterium]|nr:MAG: hypothetical protein EPO64_03340 [Nitrospirota bacterium]
MIWRVMASFLSVILILDSLPSVQAAEPVESEASCAARSLAAVDRLTDESSPVGSGVLDSVQIEISDLQLFETFFGEVLKAPLIERLDHPGKDSIRGYCYRGVLVVVRRNHESPRLAGWVQLNFAVPDVDVVQRDLEATLVESRLASLSQVERERVVRIRLKLDVRRGNRKAIRLEVFGPEGFVIGFNQYQS